MDATEYMFMLLVNDSNAYGEMVNKWHEGDFSQEAIYDIVRNTEETENLLDDTDFTYLWLMCLQRIAEVEQELFIQFSFDTNPKVTITPHDVVGIPKLEEVPMQNRPLFETKAFYDSTDLSTQSNEAIFHEIKTLDGAIEDLTSLAKESKAAEKAVKLMQADRTALIKHVDSRK